MTWGWKFLVIEAAIFSVASLMLYPLEHYALRRLTKARVEKWRPQQIAALSDGAETLRLVAKVLSRFTILALGALLLLAIMEPPRWTVSLGLALAVVCGYLTVRRLARFWHAMQVRIQSLVSDLSSG